MDKKSFGTLTNILVNEKSRENLPTNIDRTKQTVLPPGSATPGSGGRDIGKFEFNTPDKPNGKPLQPRTRGLPGEEYGNPSKDDYNQVTRRTMTGTLISLIAFEEALEEDLFEDADFSDEDENEEFKQWKRQKNQRGKKRTDSRNYYKRKKHKIKRQVRKNQRKPKTKLKTKKRNKRNKNRNTKRRASVFSVVSMYLRGK